MGFQDGHSEAQKKLDRKVLDKVREGIEFLKKEYGEDWVDHIDMEYLDLRDGSCCILGQLYGEQAEAWDNGYTYATKMHQIGPSSPLYAAFCVRDHGSDASWDALQYAWEYEIENILRAQREIVPA